MERFDDFRELLMDWTNRDEVGTRFPSFRQPYGLPEKIVCPVCYGSNLLSDDWPPNYGGGHAGGGFSSMSAGFKIICVDCRVHIRGGFSVEHENGVLVDSGVSYQDPVLLQTHERHPGKLLTPHDISREEYFDEHGEYQRLAYG